MGTLIFDTTGCLWASSAAQAADCGEWFASEASEFDRGT